MNLQIQNPLAPESGGEWIHSLPRLGAGLGFRVPFKGELFLNRKNVDFLEITADHFFDATEDKQRELELLSEHFTLIPHGLNLSLGTAEGLDSGYVDKFAALVRRLDPPYWSEHIAFTRAGGIDIGHLTPLPFNQEAVEVLVSNIRAAKALIGNRVILENITFSMKLPGNEMSETEFLTQVVEKSDCGMLLDVTNLYINAMNHGFDPIEFLDEIPMERVVQLHFVGGYLQDGVWVDSHSEITPQPVWDLMQEVLRRGDVKGIILERDDNIPAFSELLGEVRRARSLMQAARSNG